MFFAACDGAWTQAGGSLSCSGTLVAVDASTLSPPGITAEEGSELTGQALILFAIVFGFLALRKAL